MKKNLLILPVAFRFAPRQWHQSRYDQASLWIAMLLFTILMPRTAATQSMSWQSAITTTASGTPPNGVSPYYNITESVQDASGNIIIVGGFQGTITFGSTTLETGSSQLTAAFIAKWNPTTTTWMWAYSSGTINGFFFYHVATSSNALYVAGSFNGSTTVAGVPLTSPGNNGLFLAKFIDNGTSLSNGWAVGMSGSFQQDPPFTSLSTCGIAVVGNAVYMAGDFTNDITLQGTTLNSAGSRDVYVAKYIDNGASASNGWAIRAGGTDGESPLAMAASASGVYLAGSFTGTNNYGTTTLTSSGSGSDVFLVKFADNGSSGSVGWALKEGGSSGDAITDLVVNGSTIYAGGNLTGTDATLGGTALTNAASTTSVFVAKYTDNGTTVTPRWGISSTANGSSSGQVRGIGLDGSSVFITGFFNTSITVAGTALTGSGGNEIYVARFTDNGTTVTGSGALSAGSSASGDVGASVLPSGSTLYTTGTTRAGSSFGSYTIPNNGPALLGYIASINLPAVVALPNLVSLSPTSGAVGTSLTLSGTNLSDAASVSFNGTTTTAITNNTATSLNVVVPAGATTGNVTVTTPGGTSNGLAFTVQTSPQTRYVNAARPNDSGDGLTWATAHKYLQTALAAAQSGDQIWVAQGTYKPTTSTTDREASFVMKENVKIYGGFTSGQDNLDDRNTNPETNATILSGDINNDGELTGNTWGIIYNVDNGLTNEAILDGFKITGGNVDIYAQFRSGGMYNKNSSPKVVNCLFQNNFTFYQGGAMHNDNTSTVILNCTFQDNHSASFGGALYFNDGRPEITNCIFQENSSEITGGAILNESETLQCTNSTFFRNSTINGGGAVNNSGGTITKFTNCSFEENRATEAQSRGGAIENSENSMDAINCSFQGNTAFTGGAIENIGSNVRSLTNCVLFGNGGQNTISGTVNATNSLFEASETDYSGSNNLTTTVNPFISTTSTELRPCSPAIDAGSDAANNTPTDLAGNNRKVGTIDMGAYEYQSALPAITATLSGGGTITSGNSTNLTVTLTGGTSPYTVVYLPNGGSNTTVTSYPNGANIPVSPVTTTTYSLVSVTDANGCTAGTLQGSATVTVAPASVGGSVAGSATVCSGSNSTTLTLSGQVGDVVKWQSSTASDFANPTDINNTTSSLTATNLTQTTYYRAVVQSGADSPVNSSVATITVSPIPSAPTLSDSPGNTTTNQPITVTASGCEGGTIAWNTTGGTDTGDGTYTYTAPGSYSVSVTCTQNGCESEASETLSLSISDCPAITATFNGTTTLCAGGSTDLSITLSGGTAPYTIVYSDGSSNQTLNNYQSGTEFSVSPASTTTYTFVSATDANGCAATFNTESNSATVTVNPVPGAPTLSANPGSTTTNQSITISANGCENGSIIWSPTGGTGTASGNQYTFSQPGTYSISATCTVEGCTSESSETLNLTINNCTLALGQPTVTDLTCFQSGDGAIALTATGGAGSLTYTLSPGNVPSATGSFNGLSAGTYTVSVTDANQCTATSGTVEVTQPEAVPAPTLSASPGNTTTNQPITVSAAGCAGTLSWNATGGTDNGDGTYTFSAAGSYSISATCTVEGCTSPASETLNLTINSCTLALGQPTVTDLTCFQSGDGAIALTATGGAGSLTYTLSPGNVPSATGSFNGLSAGTYTVSVTDANQCTATSGTIQLTQPEAVPAPTLSASPGNTTTNQPITVSATGCAGTLSWNATGGTDNGDGTYTFSAPGSYTISATCTVGGCTSQASETLNLSIGSCTLALGQPTVTDLTCFQSGDGAIALTATGGAGSLTYTLSPGNVPSATGSFNGLSAGTYTVSVTDANQCTTTSGTIQLTQPEAVPAPTLSAAPGNTTTNQPIAVSAAGCAGTLSWNATGGTDNGDGTYTFSAPGSYTISATCTVGGCTSESSETLNLTIGDCPAISAGFEGTTTLCAGVSTDLSVTLSGGTAPYTIVYSNGSTNTTLNDYQSGSPIPVSPASTTTYTIVSATDASGCAATAGTQATVTVNPVPDAPTLSVSPASTTNGQPITVTAQGCNGTVSWTAGGGTGTANGNQYTFSAPGSYTLSATCTVNGCTSPPSQELSVTINACPTIALNVSGTTSITYGYGSNCTTLTADGSGGTAPYTYLWQAGNTQLGSQAGQQLCPTTTTTYTVTVTDANGCTGSRQVTVYVSDVRCGSGIKMCSNGREVCVAQYLVPTFQRMGYSLGACNAPNARIGYEPSQDEPGIKLTLTPFPNPTQGPLKVQVLSPAAGVATFELVSALGREVQRREQVLNEGLNELSFELGGLPAGHYLLRCRDARGRQATVRVSRQ